MLEWEWWGDDRMVKMFVYLLLSCNAEPGSFHGVDILPGEVVIGRKTLAERLHMDERVVRSTLDKLVSTGEIAKWTNNHFTKITVRNWEKYQFANQLSDQTPTESQPIVQPNDGVLTSKTGKTDGKSANHLSNQPPTDCPTNCHKQEERSKEESISCGDTKEASAPKSSPSARKRKDRPESAAEVIEYCRSRGNTIDGQYFFDRMEARGWTFKDGKPVKDWKACIRTWEKFESERKRSAESSPAEPWQGRTTQMEERDVNGEGFV